MKEGFTPAGEKTDDGGDGREHVQGEEMKMEVKKECGRHAGCEKRK